MHVAAGLPFGGSAPQRVYRAKAGGESAGARAVRIG